MKYLWLGILLLGGTVGRAQWFGQNAARLKDYAQQIAELQVMIGETEKGMQISSSGLSTIEGSKQGEYDLHSGYYDSLWAVNPAVARLPEVQDIIALQAAIVQRMSASIATYAGSGKGAAYEVAYLTQVYDGVVQAGLADVGALSAVLHPGQLQMTDDQRIAVIKALDRGMKRRYVFALACKDQAGVMGAQRTAEAVDAGTLKGLYGIP